jgi:hypothetical protein
MYQSPKGIYLLDRSLKDHYIGADVEAYNAFTVTSAVMVPNTTQVRFTLSNGVALVYDYYLKDERGIGQWSVFTNVSAVAATVFQGVYTYIKSSGQVNKENSSVFTDNGDFVQLSLETGWLSFAGLQGFQRVRRAAILGDYKSAHTLQIEAAYDFDQAVNQTATVVATSSPPYQWLLLLARQKCEAIKLAIQDNQSASFGEGLDLSGISFEVGIKGGVYGIGQSKNIA